MNENVAHPTNPGFPLLSLGALAAVLYVVAQLVQQVVFRFYLPETPDAAAEIASRLLPANELRKVLVFASLFLVPLAYVALAASRWKRAPGAVIVGLVFGLVFSVLESAYRSIDLFAVGEWAAEFVGTTDSLRRGVLLERFDIWEDSVLALYLPLLAAHALASAAFGYAVVAGGWRRLDLLDRLLAVALGINAARAVLRILQMHAGVTELGPINAAIYLPVTLATYGTLAAWLARAALGSRKLARCAEVPD